MFGGIYRGKTVWLSGHTGFKGAWLSRWLLDLGAKVVGFSLAPEPKSLFTKLELSGRLDHQIGDIRNLEAVRKSIHAANPDFVFHLAAQPLVRLSYEIPVETYATNVMGTIHVLEALRSLKNPAAAVMVTTDKCYENREWLHAYREEDSMGGYDPYSSSKGMAELAINSYRRSYFKNHAVTVASARAGNVIGGGDWALDRIVPDCIRALTSGQAIPVRNKIASRPWQHVLEPLSGYLALGWALSKVSDPRHSAFQSAFNFGPRLDSNRTVADLVVEILKSWPGQWSDQSDPHALHEATLLNLATDKAFHLLQWSPVWNFSETVKQTVVWYQQNADPAHHSAEQLSQLTSSQIKTYILTARTLALPWSLL